MKTQHFPYHKTGLFSSLITDYLGGKESLKEFYNLPPQLNSFKKAIESKQKESINRKVLVEVLSKQYEHIAAPLQQVKNNIERLKEVNCFTVTTGHQLCIFGGPLFVVLKIISTLNLTKQLKQHYPTYDFVPVFWMATEDHDFEEINHLYLFNKKINWENPPDGAVGELSTETLSTVLEELEGILGDSQNAEELKQLFTDSYKNQNNLTDATRCLINSLFGEDGVVVVDGNHKRLKQLFAPFVEKELVAQVTEKQVQPITDRLNEQHKTLVFPREINLFYLQKGSRERIELTAEGKYKVLNTTLEFTQEEMLKDVQEYPERYSPNVILRTLYQEQLLPNLAYIGGPGELSYWMQFKGLFDAEETAFPILVLRNSILWIDKYAKEKMAKFNLQVEDLFKDVNALTKRLVKNESENELTLKEEINQIKKVFAEIKEKAKKIDATLEATVNSAETKQTNELDKLEAKLIRAEKQNHENTIKQIENLFEKLFPNGGLAERYEGFIPLYLKHGKGFLSDLKENLNPLNAELTVFSSE